MPTMNELIESLNRDWEEFKRTDAANLEKVGRLERRMADLEAAINRPDLPMTAGRARGAGADRTADVKIEFSKELDRYLRTGEGKDDLRKRTMRLEDDVTGGYLATTEMDPAIGELIQDMSPVRSVVNVRPTGKHAYKKLFRDSGPTASWTGELETVSRSDVNWRVSQIPCSPIRCRVDVSVENLEDSDFDLSGEITRAAVEEIAVAEGEAVIDGNGVKKPEGLLTATGVSEVNSGAAAALTYDGLADLTAQLKTNARTSRLRFLFNRSTLAAVRKLKDSDGRPLWLPMSASGQAATVFDYPYSIMDDLPDVAANAYPVLFGDFMRAYTLTERIGTEMLRDPYTLAEQGIVRLFIRRRIGGQVVEPDAMVKQKVAV